MARTVPVRTLTAAGLVAAAGLAFAVAGPLGAHSETPAPIPTSTEAPAAPVETWDERVASLGCEAWQVPGWLGDDGLPTSCVNNEAVPGSHKGEPPASPASPAEEPEVTPAEEAPAPPAPAPVVVSGCGK